MRSKKVGCCGEFHSAAGCASVAGRQAGGRASGQVAASPTCTQSLTVRRGRRRQSTHSQASSRHAPHAAGGAGSPAPACIQKNQGKWVVGLEGRTEVMFLGHRPCQHAVPTAVALQNLPCTCPGSTSGQHPQAHGAPALQQHSAVHMASMPEIISSRTKGQQKIFRGSPAWHAAGLGCAAEEQMGYHNAWEVRQGGRSSGSMAPTQALPRHHRPSF
jgi:hypothetical protein